MEGKQKPAIKVISDKPPSEHPPSPEMDPPTTTPHMEDIQWIEDVQNNAKNVLQEMNKHHAIILCEQAYTRCINKITSNPKISEYHIQSKQEEYMI